MKYKINQLFHSKYANTIFAAAFILLSLLIFTQKNATGTTDIIYNRNSQITADSGDTIQQTWMASHKAVTGLSIPLATPMQGSGVFTLYLSSSKDYKDSALAFLRISAADVSSLDFTFDDHASLSLGTRYYITLECDNLQYPITLSSSSNSKSTTLNGENLEHTLSATIIYEKNSSLFLLYTILLMIGTFSLTFMLIFQKSFEQVVGFALIIIILILYILGLIGLLAYGSAVLFVSTLLLLIASFFLIRKKGLYFADLISPGLIVWLAGFLLIAVYNHSMKRTTWDEYSHWGAVVKDMFYYDSLSNHAGTTVIHTAYPPFISLVQYLFLSINGVFSENYLYIAMQLAIFSFLIVILKDITWSKCKFIIPGCGILILTPMIIFSDVYSTLYVDALLGILMAYLLICYFSEGLSLFNVLRISLGMAALSLTKDMGVLMAGISFFIILFHTIIIERKIFTKKTGTCFMLLLFILLSFTSWQVFASINFNPDLISTQSNALSRSNITYESLSGFFRGDGSDGQYHALQSFITSFFDDSEYNYILGPLSFPFFPFLLFMLIITWIFSRLKAMPRIRKLLEITFLATLGSFLYGGFLLLAYLFAFPYHDMIILSSYYRYMGSYLSAILITIIFVLFMNFALEEHLPLSLNGFRCSLLTVVILLIVTPVTLLVNRPIYTRNLDHLYEYDEIVALTGSFADKNELVHYVCSSKDGFYYFLFHDAVVPARTGALPDYTIDPSGAYDASAWVNLLINGGYDYVYIRETNSELISSCSSLFEGGANNIQSNTFYKVNVTEGNSLLLTPIAGR